jgi:hypothetical protein
MCRYKQRGLEAKTVGHMRELDDALAQLTSAVPVDLMSGVNDPSNLTVPQQVGIRAHLATVVPTTSGASVDYPFLMVPSSPHATT